MDILQPLPIEKWSALRDTLKEDWPTYGYYYTWVSNAMKWKQKAPHLQHEIFCPNGSYESGIFIGVSTYSLYGITVFSFQRSKELLRKVLAETKIIDWTKHWLFGAVHQYFNDVVLEVLREKEESDNVEIECTTVTYYHFKPKEECSAIEFQIPEECVIRHLTSADIPLIHSLWPHRSKAHPELSTKLLSTLVEVNRGVGLFLKADDSLVSWVLHSDWGGLCTLQTLEEHKRKGYGKIVVQAMIKEVATEEKLDSVLYITEQNVASDKLFKSLGYARLTSATWYNTKQK